MSWLKTGTFQYAIENKVTKIVWGQDPQIGKWRDTMSLGKSYLVMDGNADTIIDCRIYYSSGSTVRCAVWVSDNHVYEIDSAGKTYRSSKYTRGAGSAGGCGYDKYSAAVASAFSSAGITLEKDIGDVGHTATRGALEALALKILGRGKRFTIIEAHN